jgi:serine/threonine-protein kinase
MEDQERLTKALADRYQIQDEIGEGGMATVFMAEDLKHNRKVAVKVLKPELAAVVGAERFLAEIETTANLTHPHILPLHDSGEADGFLFYVMPYIEGESLRDRLDREQQLPVHEAVRIASDLAEALDYAHRHEVVHRDIKPANILMHEGRPVIADFGIALAVGSAGAARLTETGLSMGTPYYMSPEQATGDQAVGPATDIYALGCVLHEMLVGEPPYVGATAQAVLGKIISGGTVFAREKRGSIPANVDAAIRKALEKLPSDRFSTAQAFAEALADPTFRHGERAPTAVGPWRRLTLGVGALAAILAIAFGWLLSQPDTPVPTMRLSLNLPDNQAWWDPDWIPAFDISADGSLMVYVGPGETEGTTGLWIRPWDALEARRIPNTEGAMYPQISPDGQEVAFYVIPDFRILPLHGGVTRNISGDSLPSPFMRWGSEGRWLYFQGRNTDDLYRVPSTGGPVEPVAQFDTAQAGNMWFDVLPNEKGAVIELTFVDGPVIHALDFETGESTVLTVGQFPRYANGQLLFGTPDGSTIMSAPFDMERMELAGPSVPVADGLLGPVNGWNFFAASQTGMLLFATGSPVGARHEVVWVSRDGEVTSIDPEWTFDPGTNNRGLSLSPDGARLAVTNFEDDNYDVWLKELPQGPATRFTFGPAQDLRPRFTPDGRSVTFLSDRDAQANFADVYLKSASGTGEPVRVMEHDLQLWEAVYAPDMEWLLGRTGGTRTAPGGRDVWAIQLGTDTVPRPLIVTEFDEKAISLSPDGRFLLYESDETGRNEVYVRPFPNAEDGKWTVSIGGGVMPLWSHGGGEIFYVDATEAMTVATVETDPSFRVTGRTTLFDLPPNLLFRQGEQYPLYDIAPDDSRFVWFRRVSEATDEPDLILVQNWLGELDGG